MLYKSWTKPRRCFGCISINCCIFFCRMRDSWAKVTVCFAAAFTISCEDKMKTEQKVFPDERSVFLLSLLEPHAHGCEMKRKMITNWSRRIGFHSAVSVVLVSCNRSSTHVSHMRSSPTHLQKLDVWRADYSKHTGRTHASHSGSAFCHGSCRSLQESNSLTTVCVCVCHTNGGEKKGEEEVLCSFLSFCRNVRRECMTHQPVWEPHGPFPDSVCVCVAVCLFRERPDKGRKAV